jgi:hypothetical protein
MRKFVKGCYFELDTDELDRIICEHFGLEEYSCWAEREWHRNTLNSLFADEKDYTPELVEKADQLQPGEALPLSDMMTVLAGRGVIPYGRYLISTW